MRRLRNWIMLALFSLLPFPASNAPAAQQRPGQQLIERVKAIADAGRLTDSAFVGRTLHMAFDSRTESQSPITLRCAPGLTPREGTNTFLTPTPASALKPTPYGRESMTRAGFGTINAEPATVRGATELHYIITEFNDCSGYIRLSHGLTADLDIGPISTYDCVTPGELRAWLPAAEDGSATDGAIVIFYTGRNGVTATFQFFVGTPCMLGISLRQDPADTPRYQAALEKQKACMLPHEATFCASHAPFSWADGDVQDEMASFATAKCGTIDSFLKRTPASAKPPTSSSVAIPYEDIGTSTPCSRVHATIDALKRRR